MVAWPLTTICSQIIATTLSTILPAMLRMAWEGYSESTTVPWLFLQLSTGLKKG